MSSGYFNPGDIIFYENTIGLVTELEGNWHIIEVLEGGSALVIGKDMTKYLSEQKYRRMGRPCDMAKKFNKIGEKSLTSVAKILFC